MRKMILFVAFFFIFDRFMNYKLNHHSKKARIVAVNDAVKRYILLSEKKERNSDEHKKIIVAQTKSKNVIMPKNGFLQFQSSNRNV